MVNLIELLGNKSLAKLLDFFILNPTKEFSQTSIKKQTNLAKATLTKWLSRMEKEKLIQVKVIGVSKLYRLENGNILIRYLKILDNIIKLKEIEKLKKKYNIKIYLYGSAARGEDNEKSDIDLLIMGKIKKEDIVNEINKISDKINRKITFQIFNMLEWSNLSTKDKAFYERVEKDKIEL